MKILLTNDDGFGAAGILALERAFSCRHEIFVIAPDGERSACSNALSVRSPMLLKPVSQGRFILSGYPSDCVNAGIKAGVIPDVDCIVSGINAGPNIGDDVFFSGTVGAARMGSFLGKPAFAVSLNSRDMTLPALQDAADFMVRFAEKVMACSAGNFLFNINYPAVTKDLVRGCRWASLTKRNYGDEYIVSDAPAGKVLILDGKLSSLPETEDSDAALLEKGFITVTPLGRDCTDHVRLGSFSLDEF